MSRLTESRLSLSEFRLLDQLRREAEAVKDCFTQFAFRAWALSTAALGLLITGSRFVPEAAFVAPFIVLVILSVVRIGLHKYGTANRHFGFELYMNRRRRIAPGVLKGSWQPYMRDIGWEEAHYAWRVVQSALYKEIYDLVGKSDGFFSRITFRARYKQCILVNHSPRSRDKTDAYYHPGGYLEKTTKVLHLYAFGSLLPLLASAYHYFSKYAGDCALQWTKTTPGCPCN